MLCIDPKMPFIKYSKLFPLQKVKFLFQKIPIGEKRFFLSAKQGKQENARGIKSELYLKKSLFNKQKVTSFMDGS